MLIEHRGCQPHVHDDAFVASTAVVSGDVEIAAGARILHGAVVSAEDGAVRIGADTIVMEHAVIRGRATHPVTIGSSVMIGPHTHVNGATIDDEAFIATGASIFPGARVGRAAEVRINGVVHVNTTVRGGAVVPIGWVAVGDAILPPDRHDEIWAIQRDLDFPGTVYGVGREATMVQIMRQQSTWFGAHGDDRPITDRG